MQEGDNGDIFRLVVGAAGIIAAVVAVLTFARSCQSHSALPDVDQLRPTTSKGPSSNRSIADTTIPTIPASTDTTTTTDTTVRPSAPTIPYKIVSWPGTLSASGWSATSDWRSVGGLLTYDGSSAGSSSGLGMSAIAPLNLEGVDSYDVSADIQLVRYNLDTAEGGAAASFGIVVRSTGPTDGYGAGHCVGVGNVVCSVVDQAEYTGVIWAFPSGGKEPLMLAPFHPGMGWHHYEVRVRSNTITLVIDGSLTLGPVTDNRYFGGLVGLWSNGAQIDVREFAVTAP